MHTEPSPEDLRARYADTVLRAAGVKDDRIRRVFATIPRETFLPPPPWTTISGGVAVQTGRLADIYENVLVALDRTRGINNGEPALHAAWLAAVDPRPGEHAIHVGAGTGYYSALLSALVAPDGTVDAYEIHEALAKDAARHLADDPRVRVHSGTALGRSLPAADVIYVNAAVVAPDAGWLRALNPGGRLIFPWQPVSHWGTAVLVTRVSGGFQAKPLMSVGFITCAGEKQPRGARQTTPHADITSRSLWLRDDREPDHTATAVYDEVWFSSEAVE